MTEIDNKTNEKNAGHFQGCTCLIFFIAFKKHRKYAKIKICFYAGNYVLLGQNKRFKFISMQNKY